MTAAVPVVSEAEWRAAHEALLEREKAHMREADAIAAARRRLPRLEVRTDYRFEGEQGPVSLLDLFEGRSQLLVYHFMFGEGVEGWPDAGCVGCTMFLDQVGHLAHLHARDVTFCAVAPGPITNLAAYRARMGWQAPFYSLAGDLSFNHDHDVRGGFRFNAFLREGDRVLRTYSTSGRGVEAIGTVWSMLDRAPYGRQETWEDAPAGTPQGPPYAWWHRHDEYLEPAG